MSQGKPDTDRVSSRKNRSRRGQRQRLGRRKDRAATALPLRSRAVVWFRSKHPVFRFVAIFSLLVAGFYLVAVSPWYQREVLEPYLALNARVTAALLRSGGDAATAEGAVLDGARFSLEVRAGCDALEPAALFAAAVLAFPAPPRRKLSAFLLGVSALLIINLVRILSLYYIGVHLPSYLSLVHTSVWQPLFILLVACFWLVWAVRVVTGSNKAPAGAA
jgi:exosortase H (IPTLxxWG-CTERM-specific)